MRAPARIDRVIEKLRAAWISHPDWRLGQLLVNAGCTETAGRMHSSFFYVEDDEIERALDALSARK